MNLNLRIIYILEKGEVLTSLYEKLNSARSINTIKAVHPETSIIENALFTGSKNEPSMLSELKKVNLVL